jgi:hypothetical protein
MPNTERVFRSIDHIKRSRIPEAPVELVEPTKNVVREAMRLVRKGSIDSVDRQSVVVQDPQTQIHLTLMDVGVKDQDGTTVSTGSLRGGLFIYQAEVDENGEVVQNAGDGIQAPRSEDEVSQESIYLLRGIYPDAMQEVAEMLRRSKVVEGLQF